jgi:two-component system response regulator
MRNSTILLVEDNPRDEALTLRALKKHNVANDIQVARDGVEALEVLRTATTLPDLVLLDLKLPKVDGLEVLEQMRADERLRAIPVVIFTSSSQEEDMVKGYGLGANSYVRKPVDFDHFMEATRQLGLYWLMLNEPPPRS